MIVARLIAPASKLATARMLDPLTAASSLGAVLGLGPVDEDELYVALDGSASASRRSRRRSPASICARARWCSTTCPRAIWRALLRAGAQLSVQPVYASPEAGKEQKLVGYNVGNHVNAKIKHIDRLGDVLDRMIAAGATEVWNVEFLVSDPGKALDQAREAAIADALRKAEVYSRAARVTIGRVFSIEEELGPFAPVPRRALAQPAGTQMPIAPGESTLHATVTVGFEIAGK